jgi:hypothetical protein
MYAPPVATTRRLWRISMMATRVHAPTVSFWSTNRGFAIASGTRYVGFQLTELFPSYFSASIPLVEDIACFLARLPVVFLMRTICVPPISNI